MAERISLPPIGPAVSVGSRIVTPVVAPDGSLYVGVPKTGAVGRVRDGLLTSIPGVAAPGHQMAVVLAGSQPVGADLTAGVVRPLGVGAVAGEPAQAADGALAAAAGRPLAVVVRDAHRYPAARDVVTRLLAARPDAVVVEMGLPVWQPPHAVHVATYGAARISGLAAAEILGLAPRPTPLSPADRASRPK